MKAIKKETNEKGYIILTCESSYLGLFKIQEKFIATEERPRGYWDWRRLPNKTIVTDNMSFQLDSWCKDFD